MIEHGDVKAFAKKNYSMSSPWPNDDIWHSYTQKTIQSYVQKSIDEINLSSSSIILNAGCGTTTYDTLAHVIYMDIIEEYVKPFKDHIVASVEKIPLLDASVDVVICVGSVVNYADIQRAFFEFSRILIPEGYLILEYERSNSAEFLFTSQHSKTVFQKEYHYNGQIHHLWMYDERFVKSLSDYYDFSVIRKYRFHTLSSILYRIGISEERAAWFSSLDNVTQLLSYPFAHNEIIVYRKRSLKN